MANDSPIPCLPLNRTSHVMVLQPPLAVTPEGLGIPFLPHRSLQAVMLWREGNISQGKHSNSLCNCRGTGNGTNGAFKPLVFDPSLMTSPVHKAITSVTCMQSCDHVTIGIHMY